MDRADQLPEDIRPTRYIEKVSLATGEVLDDTIHPRDLLVNSHRDLHFADIQAQRLLSRVVRRTGDERLARTRLKELRRRGERASGVLAKMIGQRKEFVSHTLFGLRKRDYHFRYKRHGLNRDDIQEIVSRLQQETETRLDATRDATGRPRIRLLLTGGTGFLGQEILWQAAHDPAIVEVVALIRPKTIRDRKTKEVVKVLSPAERGEALLRRLWLDTPEKRAKFRFVAGDVEQERLGLDEAELERLAASLTHVIHCAASVAFDDPYEQSFRANVEGTLNALSLSRRLQSTPGSPFVAHLAIETSYIHGRQAHRVAREDTFVFPRNFFNNYYELTKAMASIETERFMLEHGLRVVQLCPAIVIGDSRTGNNRGDTKVINAPVNLFGLAWSAFQKVADQSWYRRTMAGFMVRMASVFPGDPSAKINIVPVDRVVIGILAALQKPLSIGRRIHLATDNRVTTEQIRVMVQEEIGVRVRLSEPTLHRNLTLPITTRILKFMSQDRLAHALDKLGTIFGGYSEWGQPTHQVRNDVEILGLPLPRPNTVHAFRMLCRHNRYVQGFGLVKDDDEVSRRERLWSDFIGGLERRTGKAAGSLEPAEFEQACLDVLDLERFEWRERSSSPPADRQAR